MDFLTCALINGPFVVLNIAANAFYIFCMACPLHGERIKQPLKLLLGSLICCTVMFLMSAISLFFTTHYWNFIISKVVFFWSLSKSMSSSVWLNFFYYTQIVPAQRALFIWIKKNIKPIIYFVWFIEVIYSLCAVGVMLVCFTSTKPVFDVVINNFTMDCGRLYESPLLSISISLRNTHFFISLCVMVMCSGSTAVYLCRHMHRMVANGQPLTCPRFRGQVRVTVTGILQGVLYAVCTVWTVYSYFSEPSHQIFRRQLSHFTVVNFYMSGTTLNLGAGQGVFRQRAADIWLRIAQCCKTQQVQQSEQSE